MKKVIFTFFVFLIVFIIYYYNNDKKIYYFSLGDYLSFGINDIENNEGGYSNKLKEYYGKRIKKYVNYSTMDDYRVMDLINDINYNKKISYNNKEYTIQNLLVKANLITISIGMNDLIYKKNIDYNYIDDLLTDINDLIILIRKYNKDKIYFFSFYNKIDNSKLIEYANNKLKRICAKNKVNYVDISDLDRYISKSSYEGYKYILDSLLNS